MVLQKNTKALSELRFLYYHSTAVPSLGIEQVDLWKLLTGFRSVLQYNQPKIDRLIKLVYQLDLGEFFVSCRPIAESMNCPPKVSTTSAAAVIQFSPLKRNYFCL